MQYLNVTTVANVDCLPLRPYSVPDTELCAHHTAIINCGICEGDAGGPLVAGGRLIGVASWNYRINATSNADGFVRVSAFAKWLDETIGSG